MVQGAPHVLAPHGCDVGVDHRRRHVAVTQWFLDGSDVVAALQEVGGEGVPERVAGSRLHAPRWRGLSFLFEPERVPEVATFEEVEELTAQEVEAWWEMLS